MSAENSSASASVEPAPALVDASEEDDFLDTDTSEVGLGLLEPLTSKATVVPYSEEHITTADFAEGRDRFYSAVPWQRHSPEELTLNQADWIEWEGGKVGGRPVGREQRTSCNHFKHIRPSAGLAFPRGRASLR